MGIRCGFAFRQGIPPRGAKYRSPQPRKEQGSVRGRGGNCCRAGGVTGVAIEVVGLWWSCELQPRTEETPDDRDQHALDRAFAKA